MIEPWGLTRTLGFVLAVALFCLALTFMAVGVALDQHRYQAAWLDDLAHAAYAAGGTLLVLAATGVALAWYWA